MISDKATKRFFYLTVGIALALFFLSVPLTHYESLRLYLWKKGSSFYDYFSCLKANIYWNRNEIYQSGTIYPPLANLFYVFITRCMSTETLRQLEDLSDYNKIKALQDCSISFVLYMNVLLLFYYVVCTEWKKGKRIEKLIFASGMLFTVPFLYQFERANIIFLAMVLTMLFFAWKDSENKIVREMSYLSLALAAGLKLYPAIFGLLLLREKKYRDAGRLILYGIMAFILPFIFCGGMEGLLLLINNLGKTSASFSATRIGYQLDYVTLLKNAFKFLGGNSVYIGKLCRIILVILGVGATFWLKKTWKSVLLLTCMIIGVPSISYVYVAIFMILPIVMYLDSGEKEKKDLIYLAGMILVIIPLPFCWREGSGDAYYAYMHVSTPVWVEAISIMVMTLCLIAEGIRDFAFTARRKAVAFSSACIAVMLSVFLNRGSFGAPFAYTDYLSKTLTDHITVTQKDLIQQSFEANEQCLDYIILKMKPSKDGILNISVKSAKDGREMFHVSQEMQKLKRGNNKIIFDNCRLIPSEQYILELSADESSDSEILFWKTIDSWETKGQYFAVNGEKQKGALGIQLYESAL